MPLVERKTHPYSQGLMQNVALSANRCLLPWALKLEWPFNSFVTSEGLVELYCSRAKRSGQLSLVQIRIGWSMSKGQVTTNGRGAKVKSRRKVVEQRSSHDEWSSSDDEGHISKYVSSQA